MKMSDILQILRESTAKNKAEEVLRKFGINQNIVKESKTTKKNDPYTSILQYLDENDDVWKKFSTKKRDQFFYRHIEDKSELFINHRGKDDLGFIQAM